ncbi:PREDICTED: protein NRT1/ PTR FAMILY 5.10 isoform X1 [Theobroma cacao]|uniref:Protein NRT1/ PTR FAMILY 5.10 isoform X1 n=1 Tax=Theobroma cacao TaxID=3641 RepID=A0AB32WV75_THECC|nr:PREDICTED: protein NRT1/ PTR FAMILY 5.10 isoform X1 [Theobroma cacao]
MNGCDCNFYNNCFSSKWTWASNYVRFSRGALFISGLLMSDAFVDNAFRAFLISYIQFIWVKSSLRKAAAFANAFEGVTMFTSIVLDHIAADRIGQFKLLVCTVPALIIALLVLWLSSWLLASHVSNIIFYVALTLFMLGTAGQDASLKPFLYDQFRGTMDIDETEIMEDQFSQKQQMEKYEDTFINRAKFWTNIAAFLGTFVSSTFASSLDWDETFKVSLIIVVVAYLVFCSGKCCYDHEDPVGKTVAERMNQAKPLVKLLPLWITFIVYSLVEATGYTLFIEQSENLDDRIDLRIPIYSFNRIPLTSFYVLQTFTTFIISLLCDFLIKKFWSSEESIQHRARFVRIGIGMFFAIGCCIAAWRVEVHRLSSISKFESKVGRRISEDDTIPMTILWLAPQFFLLGIVEGVIGKGLKYLFYDRVPVSMWVLEYPFNGGVLGFGRFVSVILLLLSRPWIGDTINESYMDKYLLMLAILNIFTLFLYIFLTYKHDWNVIVPQNESHVAMEELARSH